MRIVAKRLIKDGKIDEVIKIYEELVALTRQENGCIAYALCQDVDNPRLLAVIEEWQDIDCLEKHMRAEHFVRLVPKLYDLTEEKFNIEKYNQLI